jgi:nucleotide-binding universal stress UspA family protein
MLRHVLVCLKASQENTACQTAAMDLGVNYGAVLTGLYVRALPPAPMPMSYPLTGFVIGEPLALSPGTLHDVDERVLEHESEQDRRQDEVFTTFLRRARSSQVRAGTIVRVGDVQEEIVHAAQATDLVVLGRGGAETDSLLGSVTGAIVRHVRRPVLLVPEWRQPLEKIVVAYDGSIGSDRALAIAADLAVHYREVNPEVVLVGITRHELDPLAFLEAARRYLNAYDIPHRVRTAPGEAGVLINALALNEDASLLCMGAYGHSLVREALLGSTTQQIVHLWRRPLLLCH